jgi:hypothetical protein
MAGMNASNQRREAAMQWLKRLFRKQKIEAPGESSVPTREELPPATLLALGRLLADERSGELNCDEVLDLLCQFAEMAQRGQDPTGLLPDVDFHLQLCGDCREEYEALRRILQAPAAG